jgi:hypothetical protein
VVVSDDETDIDAEAETDTDTRGVALIVEDAMGSAVALESCEGDIAGEAELVATRVEIGVEEGQGDALVLAVMQSEPEGLFVKVGEKLGGMEA